MKNDSLVLAFEANSLYPITIANCDSIYCDIKIR